MTAGPGGPSDRIDVDLQAYGVRLVAAARALRQRPYDELALTLRQVREVLEGVGRLTQDATWLRQREDYLADAVARVVAGVGRLDIALAAPLESDLSVEIRAVRDAVAYFRDVAADVVPAAVYRDISARLRLALDRRPPAPGLYVQVLPLVDRLLSGMRRAGILGDELARRADGILAPPVPGYGRPEQPRSAPSVRPPGEIGGILLDLRRRATDMRDVPREDEATYERAVRDCFDLTPGQLAVVLSRHVAFPAPTPGHAPDVDRA